MTRCFILDDKSPCPQHLTNPTLTPTWIMTWQTIPIFKASWSSGSRIGFGSLSSDPKTPPRTFWNRPFLRTTHFIHSGSSRKKSTIHTTHSSTSGRSASCRSLIGCYTGRLFGFESGLDVNEIGGSSEIIYCWRIFVMVCFHWWYHFGCLIYYMIFNLCGGRVRILPPLRGTHQQRPMVVVRENPRVSWKIAHLFYSSFYIFDCQVSPALLWVERLE